LISILGFLPAAVYFFIGLSTQNSLKQYVGKLPSDMSNSHDIGDCISLEPEMNFDIGAGDHSRVSGLPHDIEEEMGANTPWSK